MHIIHVIVIIVILFRVKLVTTNISVLYNTADSS